MIRVQKKGTISFIERNEEWDTIAQREIEHLKVLLALLQKMYSK